MNDKLSTNRMRVSFDLDEVLFVSPKTHKTEPALPFPLNHIYKERLRLGTPGLIHRLRAQMKPKRKLQRPESPGLAL